MKVIFVLFVLAAACVIYADASCDIGTDSGCFTIVSHPNGGWNKKAAEDQCRDRRARLADLRTKEEFTAVYEHLEQKRPTTMVLLAMTYKNGQLKLSDGSKVSYAPVWYEGHPKDDKNFNDVMMIVTGMPAFSGIMNAENNCVFSNVLCRDI